MRCKSCDSILEENEIVWYEEEQTHEELCSTCLNMVRKYMAEDEVTTLIDEDNEHETK